MQHVDTSELRHEPVERAGDLALVRDVGDATHDVARRRQRLGCAPESGLVEVDEAQYRALLCEAPRRRQADPARSAGDDHDLAAEAPKLDAGGVTLGRLPCVAGICGRGHLYRD